MFRERVFADATACYEDADFVIFGVPFDATSSFRYGSREAPDVIRKASYNFETYNDFFDVDLTDLCIHDLGDLDLDTHTGDMLLMVHDVAAMILRDSKIPIALGGEHTLTYGCVRAFTGASDDPTPYSGVIILDAHLDLRDEYLGVGQSHACVSRNIIDDLTDKCVLIGVRSGSAEEYAHAKEQGILWHSADDVNDAGIETVINETLGTLFDRGCERIYLSLDIDVIDPAYAPGVGNPEPFGLSPRDVRAAIRLAAPYTCGFDIAEVNPGYDNGESAMLGARLVREFIAAKSVC